MNLTDVKARRKAPLDTPTDLTYNAARDISGALTTLLADMFALYLKTKNFHWHMSGPQFRDYHLLLDEQEDVAGASLLENWIDEAERRVWFLFEATRLGASGET
jgi:DNA-binding ferritin-like protein